MARIPIRVALRNASTQAIVQPVYVSVKINGIAQTLYVNPDATTGDTLFYSANGNVNCWMDRPSAEWDGAAVVEFYDRNLALLATATLRFLPHTTGILTTDTSQTITAVHTFNPATAGAPFALGANAQGRLVSGLNADFWRGKGPGDLALALVFDGYVSADLTVAANTGQWIPMIADYDPEGRWANDRFNAEPGAYIILSKVFISAWNALLGLRAGQDLPLVYGADGTIPGASAGDHSHPWSATQFTSTDGYHGHTLQSLTINSVGNHSHLGECWNDLRQDCRPVTVNPAGAHGHTGSATFGGDGSHSHIITRSGNTDTAGAHTHIQTFEKYPQFSLYHVERLTAAGALGLWAETFGSPSGVTFHTGTRIQIIRVPV